MSHGLAAIARSAVSSIRNDLAYFWARWPGRVVFDHGRFRVGAETVRSLRAWTSSWKDPQLTVCIPTRDRLDLLVPCLTSLANTARDRRVGVLLGDTGSSASTHDFYASAGLPSVSLAGPFSFSRICNRLAEAAPAERLLFLNSDTEARTRDWVPRLLESPDEEVTGALLLYPGSDRVQHAGVEVVSARPGTRPANVYRPPRRYRRDFPLLVRHSHIGRRAGELPRDPRHETMAVTGAFLSASKRAFHDAGGFDEAYEVDLQDTDLCLTHRELGGTVVCRTDIAFTHRHAGTRGRYAFPVDDWRLFFDRWRERLAEWAV